MTVKLSDELRQAIASQADEPLRLVDERTGAAYVLLPVTDYQRLKEASDEDISDTYAAQMESAMRAGWDDPAMDAYNNYDENFRKIHGRDPR